MTTTTVLSLDGLSILDANLAPGFRANSGVEQLPLLLPLRVRLSFLDALSAFLTRLNPTRKSTPDPVPFTTVTDLTQAPPELRDSLRRIYNVGQYWLNNTGSLHADTNAKKAVARSAGKVAAAFQTQPFLRYWNNGAEFVYTVPIDSNSLVRNTISAVDMAKGGVSALSAVTTLSGVIAMPAIVYAGSKLAMQGWKEAVRAWEINDREGFLQGAMKAGGGGSYAALGAGFIPAFGPDFLSLISSGNVASSGVGAAVAQAGGFAVNGLGLALYVAVAIGAIHGIAYMEEFRNDFTDILYQKGVKDRDKALQALRFLKQQFTLTEADAAGLSKDADAKVKKAQEKWDRFVRRVGKKCAVDVFNEVDELLEEVQKLGTSTLADVKQLQSAKDLIDKVDRASFQEKVKQVLLLIIAIVGITATILSILAMTIGTGGIASAVLTAGAAALWLTVDSSKIHAWVGRQAAKVFLKQDHWTDFKPTENAFSSEVLLVTPDHLDDPEQPDDNEQSQQSSPLVMSTPPADRRKSELDKEEEARRSRPNSRHPTGSGSWVNMLTRLTQTGVEEL